MSDRVIRDELLSSERWLDLPTDASRLAFVGFVLTCDDFGNFEGGQRRLFRFLHGFTQIKTEDAAAAVIDALMACDLIRRYAVAEREFFHIPRFKSHRQYFSRHYPASPWCPADIALGKDKRVFNKGLAKNLVTTSLPRSNHVAEGVEVEVDVDRKPTPVVHPVDAQTPEVSAGNGVVMIPLTKNQEWPCPPGYLAELESAYPDVAGLATLREIRIWFISNPTECKEEADVMKFINAWFERTQNA